MAPTHASLWPPPPKCTARSGFQPTNATASARRRETRPASSAAARTATAASILYDHAARSAEPPAKTASGSDAAVKPGP